MQKLLTALGLSALLLLSGCNTVQGVGRDVQKAGSSLEGAATRAAR